MLRRAASRCGPRRRPRPCRRSCSRAHGFSSDCVATRVVGTGPAAHAPHAVADLGHGPSCAWIRSVAHLKNISHRLSGFRCLAPHPDFAPHTPQPHPAPRTTHSARAESSRWSTSCRGSARLREPRLGRDPQQRTLTLWRSPCQRPRTSPDVTSWKPVLPLRRSPESVRSCRRRVSSAPTTGFEWPSAVCTGEGTITCRTTQKSRTSTSLRCAISTRAC